MQLSYVQKQTEEHDTYSEEHTLSFLVRGAACIHFKIKQFITQIQEKSAKYAVKRDLRSTRQNCSHRF